MSYQSKGFWTVKGTGHVNDREITFDSPSKIESKRTHQWFIDAAEADFLPNKKQAVEDENEKSGSGISSVNFSHWENNPNFNSVPNQFIGQLFGSEPKPVNFVEKNSSYAVDGNTNVRTKMIGNQYREDVSEQTEARLSFDGIKNVKVNQVKESDSVQTEGRHNLIRQNDSDLQQAYNGEAEMGYISIGQAFDKGSNVTVMDLSSNRVDTHVRTLCEAYGKDDDDDNAVLGGVSYNKEDTNTISFCGFPDEQNLIPVDRPSGDFGPLYNLSSVQIPTTANGKELNASNSNATVSIPRVDNLKPEPLSKNKPELKTAKKEAPNSFPSNVRGLISTGMLDGVPVKYVSVSREVNSGFSCLICEFAVLFIKLCFTSLGRNSIMVKLSIVRRK